MINHYQKYCSQQGVALIFTIIGAALILSLGVAIGKFVPFDGNQVKQEEGVTPTITQVVPTVPPSITPVSSATGKISGHLIYPSDHIPAQVGVCAELVENTTIKTCVEQIVDKKYTPTGVGFEMELAPGEYYVYSILGDWRAYHNQFVLCGLKAECQDHTKVPIVVTSGSENNNVQPHDWYDTPVPTVKTTITPLVSLAPSIVKLNPDALKLIPTATPTIKKMVIPTVKINYGF